MSTGSIGHQREKMNGAVACRRCLDVNKGPADVVVMSYNVLAQSLVRRDRYPTNGSIMRWAKRGRAFTCELNNYDFDLLALQEVDVHLQSFWRELLDKKGMQCVFFAHPEKKHGLCIAWKRSLYDLQRTEFIKYDGIRTGIPQQVSTGNVAFLVVLKPCKTESKRPLIFGNTHMYWHPMADYERARQLHAYITETLQLADEVGGNPRILLAGDFNSTPDSPAYHFASGRSLDSERTQMLEESVANTYFGPLSSTCDSPANPPVLEDANCSQLMEKETALTRLQEAYAKLGAVGFSAYAEYGTVHPENSEATGEPKYTNWTDDFKATLDYIFAITRLEPNSEPDSKISNPIVVRQLLRIFEEPELGRAPNSLPRHGLSPSDHVSIMAAMAWREG